MASNSAVQCGVCTQEYDERRRCPRRLPCLHTFCTYCLNRLIGTNNKECPYCHKSFVEHAATDLQINTDALELRKYVKEKEMNAKAPQDGLTSPESQKLEERKNKIREQTMNNMNACRMAEREITALMKRNLELKNSMVRAKAMIQNEVLVKFQELTNRNLQLVEQLDLQKRVLEDQLKTIKEQREKKERNEVGDPECLQTVQAVLSADAIMRQKITEIMNKRHDQVAAIRELLNFSDNEVDEDYEDPSENRGHLDMTVLKIIEEIQEELDRGQ